MKTILKEYYWETRLCGAAVALIHLLIFLPAFRGWKVVDGANAGQFGDFIGGYLGTIFLIVSIGFISATYRNQKAANRRTAFESCFFELLKFHRENVAEIEVGKSRGRRLFVSFVREFRRAFEIVRRSAVKRGITLLPLDHIDLAYLAFYYGVGFDSSPILRDALSHQHSELVEEVIVQMEQAKEAYRKGTETKKHASMAEAYCDSLRQGEWKRMETPYVPFDGHQSRLGHYYRHLYQLMKYVDRYAPQEPLEYANLVRAQLSNHEQALLCLDSLSRIGAEWKTRKVVVGDEEKTEPGFMVKYHLIKNIPKAFFDSGVEMDPKVLFPTIQFEFEDLSDRKSETLLAARDSN